MFNILLIDYSCVGFRTLGHFPTEGKHHRLDYVSFSGAIFILMAFMAELVFMGSKINNHKFYTNLEGDHDEEQEKEKVKKKDKKLTK